MRVSIWKGDLDRALKLYPPCRCGCDTRGGEVCVGYLTASDAQGEGFSIIAETREEVEQLRRVVSVLQRRKEAGG